MIVKKILTASALRLLERLFRPVEPGPARATGVVTVDAPFVGDGAHDIRAVMPGRVDHRLVPGASAIVYFDPGVAAAADNGLDGEGAAWQARVAVQGGVGCQFGGAQYRVICTRGVAEHRAQVCPDCSDVLGIP